MKNKDTQDKSEAIGRKLIKLIYDETIMLSQKHEVGQTIAIIEMATILALSSTAFTLSKMLMSEADRNNFIKDFKDDKRNGKGEFKSADGKIYIGEFKNGKKLK